MEKRELTIEELKDIASGKPILQVLVGKYDLCVTAATLAEAGVHEASAKNRVIEILDQKPGTYVTK